MQIHNKQVNYSTLFRKSKGVKMKEYSVRTHGLDLVVQIDGDKDDYTIEKIYLESDPKKQDITELIDNRDPLDIVFDAVDERLQRGDD